jgi:superfamily I DNA/RNA helicase
MGRKKKSEQILEFTPSKYQETIFDFIQHGVGNVVVEACAGSGKTSTLVKAISLIPEDKRILFCAFNKEIVKELQTKVGKRKNVDIKTIHSLGFSILMRNFKGIDVVPHNTKYREFIMNNISYLSKVNTYALGRKKFLKYINNICSLIDYSRYNLFDTHKDIEKLIVRHDIDIIGDEIDVVIQALEWGKNNIDRVDYGDMVWLPNVLYLKTYGFDYDYIFVDEAQDLSAVQRELLMKCQRMGTRYAFFGDENQSIYNFAGADIESFRKLKNIPNTISLPLSISYRCAENIVKFAQNYVPTIESNGDGRKGEVVHHGKLEDILDGDMVLCRNNAPLVRLYTDFIKIGRKCFIRGKDIGVNLIHLLESVEEEELNVDLMKPGVFAKLYQSLFEMRNHEIIISGLDEMTVMNSSKLSNRLDMIHTLETLSEDINTKQELIDKIENIFSDKKKEGIALSTIHKAKGLEANNVYIACPTLMPSKSATQDWEKEQEHNLMYVAFTRAKNKLVFLDGSEFDYLLEKTYENIESIERQVNFILGCNTNFKIASFKQALEIVEKSNKIENIIKTNKTVLSSKAKRNNEPKLSSLQNKRLIKRI